MGTGGTDGLEDLTWERGGATEREAEQTRGLTNVGEIHQASTLMKANSAPSFDG